MLPECRQGQCRRRERIRIGSWGGSRPAPAASSLSSALQLVKVGDSGRRRPAKGTGSSRRTAAAEARLRLVAVLLAVMAAQCQSFHSFFVTTIPAALRKRSHVHVVRASSSSSSSNSGDPSLSPRQPAKRRRRSGAADDALDGAEKHSERSAPSANRHRAPVHVGETGTTAAGAAAAAGGDSVGSVGSGIPPVSLSLPWMLRLEDTSRRLEGQVRVLTGAVQALQDTVDRTTRALRAAQSAASGGAAAAAASEDRRGSRPTTATATTKQRARLFIDGTWLYYSLYEREPDLCPMVRRLGEDWTRRYAVDWARIPAVVEDNLATGEGWSFSSSGGGKNAARAWTPLSSSRAEAKIEIVSSAVFTSYRPETSQSSFRYKMFDGLKRAGYDVHMMETLGDAEKCVDIALAVELIQADCDVAILLTGDKDFLPAMARTRSPTRKLGLVSMRRSCNRALYEAPEGAILDYNVVWLEDYVDQFVVPIGEHSSGGGGGGSGSNGGARALSLFSVIKILNDFVARSPQGWVSSRDTGRYLKSLELDSATTVSDEVKKDFGSLRHLVRMLPDVYKVGDVNSDFKDDRSFLIELVAGTAGRRLQAEARRTALSEAEKGFFDRYNLRALEDALAAYGHTLQLAATGIHGIDDLSKRSERLAPPVPDYSAWKVEQLKDLCRERNLPVTGVKAALLERIKADDRERWGSSRGQERLPEGRGSAVSGALSPFAASMSAPQDVSTYLQGLIVEYLTASGGHASSRDVGRYLAANKSSTGDSRISALQELKSHFSSIAQFTQIHSLAFQRDEPSPGSATSKLEFTISLVKGVDFTDVGTRTRAQ